MFSDIFKLYTTMSVELLMFLFKTFGSIEHAKLLKHEAHVHEHCAMSYTGFYLEASVKKSVKNGTTNPSKKQKKRAGTDKHSPFLAPKSCTQGGSRA